MPNNDDKQVIDRILITTTTFGEYDRNPLSMLEEKGFNIVLNKYGRTLKSNEIIEYCRNVAGIVAGTETYDKETLENIVGLKVISRCGAGIDSIDIETVDRLGIKLFNTPLAPTLAVAELTVGLILDLLRNIPLMDRDMRESKWHKRMGSLLKDKNVGIIGFGNVGQKVGALLSPFGVNLAYYDRECKNCNLICENMIFDEILSWADIISIHISTTDGCGPLIGKKELNKMKRGSWLVNTSRGGVVDQRALHEALQEYHLSGAALDVFEEEPYSGPLKDLDNVIITPHIGSYAKEARVEMERQAVENLLKGLGI